MYAYAWYNFLLCLLLNLFIEASSYLHAQIPLQIYLQLSAGKVETIDMWITLCLQMAKDLDAVLDSHEASGGSVSYLEQVICPIYNIMKAVGSHGSDFKV